MNALETELIELVRKAARGNEVTRSSTWESLGFDSLDVTELLMQAEEKFGVQIPDQDAGALQTVGDVINYISRRRAA